MARLLLLPPVAFALLLGLSALCSLLLGRLAAHLHAQPPQAAERLEPYACGEERSEGPSQPDYRQFFPFAYFFTIAHVVALIVATMPRGSPAAAGLAAAMLACAAALVHVLLRR
ncbi:MAG TPA: hypothetical protein VLW85_07165 [Myxococcales bacterium]|nr:hypothetical protein [Myxococcales bacterium]